MKNKQIVWLGLVLVAAGFLLTGCKEPPINGDIFTVLDRSIPLGATGVSSTAALSLFFNYPVYHRGMNGDNFFTDYAAFGSSHTAGDPIRPELTWTKGDVRLDIYIKGWTAISASAARAANAEALVVHIVPREGRIKDIYENELDTATVLWNYSLHTIYTPTTTTTTLPGNLSGTVTYPGGGSVGIAGVSVALDGGSSTTTDASGNYSFSGLASGSHTISFSKTYWTFYPASETITISGGSNTKNATAELTDFLAQDSQTTENLYCIWYNGNQFKLAAGGDNATFVYDDDGSGWVKGAGTGLPNQRITRIYLNQSGDTAVAMVTGGQSYQTDGGTFGEVFSPFQDYDAGDDVTIKELIVDKSNPLYLFPSNAWNFIISGTLSQIQFTQDWGGSYTAVTTPGAGTFNALNEIIEPLWAADLNLDGDQTDTLLWAVGDNGLVYYSDDTSTSARTWSQVSSPTTDDFTGIEVLHTIGTTNVDGYITSSSGALYRITGNVSRSGGSTPSFTITEVFDGVPFALNGVSCSVESDGLTTYVCGDNGFILKSR